MNWKSFGQSVNKGNDFLASVNLVQIQLFAKEFKRHHLLQSTRNTLRDKEFSVS